MRSTALTQEERYLLYDQYRSDKRIQIIEREIAEIWSKQITPKIAVKDKIVDFSYVPTITTQNKLNTLTNMIREIIEKDYKELTIPHV